MNLLRGCRRGLTLTVAMWLTVASPAHALASQGVRYDNQRFGLHARFRTDAPRICRSATATTDHGFTMLLEDGVECDSAALKKARYIAVYTAFNAAYAAESVEQLTSAVCSEEPEVTLTSPPVRPRFSIGGRDTRMCEGRRRDGWRTIQVVTLVEKGPHVLSWIVVGVVLVTRPDRYATDFREFQRVVRSLRISADRTGQHGSQLREDSHSDR